MRGYFLYCVSTADESNWDKNEENLLRSDDLMTEHMFHGYYNTRSGQCHKSKSHSNIGSKRVAHLGSFCLANKPS